MNMPRLMGLVVSCKIVQFYVEQMELAGDLLREIDD